MFGELRCRRLRRRRFASIRVVRMFWNGRGKAGVEGPASSRTSVIDARKRFLTDLLHNFILIQCFMFCFRRYCIVLVCSVCCSSVDAVKKGEKQNKRAESASFRILVVLFLRLFELVA